jgi:hypothetical protein
MERKHHTINPQSVLFTTITFPMHPPSLDIELEVGALVGDTTSGRSVVGRTGMRCFTF